MGQPQGGKPPASYGPYEMQMEMIARQQRAMVNQPLRHRVERCRYCGSKCSEKTLRDAKCENCGATL